MGGHGVIEVRLSSICATSACRQAAAHRGHAAGADQSLRPDQLGRGDALRRSRTAGPALPLPRVNAGAPPGSADRRGPTTREPPHPARHLGREGQRPALRGPLAPTTPPTDGTCLRELRAFRRLEHARTSRAFDHLASPAPRLFTTLDTGQRPRLLESQGPSRKSRAFLRCREITRHGGARAIRGDVCRFLQGAADELVGSRELLFHRAGRRDRWRWHKAGRRGYGDR